MRWIVLLLAAALPVAAGDAAIDRATLRGIKGVGVVIDTLDAEVVRIGLTANALQARIEKRLDHAGVPVTKDAAEFVGLRIMQVHDKKGPYGLCISAGVYQPVLLSRDHNVKTATATWDVQTVVVADPKLVQEAAMTSIDDLIEAFATAWKSANPKQ
jgi:hypothetical protein